MNLPDIKSGAVAVATPPGANADRLAEVIAAGELSFLGALASRHLSSAHEELGR